MNTLEKLERALICLLDPYCIRRRATMRKTVREFGRDRYPRLSGRYLFLMLRTKTSMEGIMYRFKQRYKRWREVPDKEMKELVKLAIGKIP